MAQLCPRWVTISNLDSPIPGYIIALETSYIGFSLELERNSLLNTSSSGYLILFFHVFLLSVNGQNQKYGTPLNPVFPVYT